ncbi:MAG: hypothetical protein IPJ34_32285 [Myxococcales bacterium]|nr:hypothetical protein [Myxococcales bacterium]
MASVSNMNARISKVGLAIANVDYLASALSVSYRASETPQTMEVRLRFARPQVPRVLGINLQFASCNSGLGGGVDFDPAKSQLDVIGGDPMSLEPAMEHVYQARVASVSPAFIRQLTCTISAGEQRRPGELRHSRRTALDGTRNSVRESNILERLRNRDMFTERWPALAFELVEARVRRGLSLRMMLGAKATKKHEKALADRLIGLSVALLTVPYHEPVGVAALTTILPTIVRSDRELGVRYDLFDAHLPAALDMILNFVHRFSSDIAPVERLIVGVSR